MKKHVQMFFMMLIIHSGFLFVQCYAQAPAIQWQKSLGGTNDETVSSIQQTEDGGYIVAGGSKSTDGDITGHHGAAGTADYWIAKLDSSGAMEWQKSLGGSAGDVGFSIQQTTDGGYIVLGYASSGDGDVTGGHGSLDVWVVKLLSNGNLDWQKSFGGSGVDYGVSVAQTPNGYIVGATSYSADGDITGHHGTTSSTDIWVVKLDNSGTLLWQKSYGGDGNDFVSSISVDRDNGFIISGKSNSTNGDVTGNHGSDDCWVVKLDTAGTIEWQKSYGGTNGDAPLSLSLTNDGGYIMAGTSASNDGDVTGHHGTSSTNDYWVVKLLANGNIDWQKSYGGTENEGGNSVWQTGDGGYYVSGHSFSNDGDVTGHHGTTSTSDFWLIHLDSAGALQWQVSLGGTSSDQNVYGARQTGDGGFIAAGTSFSVDGDVTGHHGDNSVSDGWVVKLQGSPLGVREIPAPLPSAFSLQQNYPNPFNPTTVIRYELTAQGHVSLKIYDLLGKEVAVLVDEIQQAGVYETEWNADGLTSGVYFSRLEVNGSIGTTTLVLQK